MTEEIIDKGIECQSCHEVFTWTAEEQIYYFDSGFPSPKNCPECRSKRGLSKRRHTMFLTDVKQISLDQRDYHEAEEWAKYLDIKNDGAKTVKIADDKNITGCLGHIAVERLFEQTGLTFHSTRTKKFKGGDQTDIIYGENYIDVKTHKRMFSEKYFFNEDMWVFDHQPVKITTHYVFARVSPEWDTAYIYGITDVENFKQKSVPGVYKGHEYHSIKSRYLTPLDKWLLRA